MRDYSKVGPKFWIGATGKALRKAGMEAQIVALYLLTSPHANMLGLYYITLPSIAHETGLGFKGASKGLQSAIEAGFCLYDEDAEVVWVIEMARYQVGEALKPSDLRVKGVQNEYDSLPKNPYLSEFYEKYADAFCMSRCRGRSSPFEAPSKAHRSQEQEQEQEQERKASTPDGVEVAGQQLPGDAPVLTLVGDSASTPPKPEAPECPHEAIIAEYHRLLPMCTGVRVWDQGRRSLLRSRWREDPERQTLEWWSAFFEFVATRCPFLVGKASAHGDRDPFVADLEWLIKPANFRKVLDGRYQRGAA